MTVKYFQPSHVICDENFEKSSNIFKQKYVEKKIEYEIPEFKDLEDKVAI